MSVTRTLAEPGQYLRRDGPHRGSPSRILRPAARPLRTVSNTKSYSAANPVQQLMHFFRQPFTQRGKSNPLRDELLSLLSEPSPASSEIFELIERLTSSTEPFKEELLGGGPWQVVYTSGPLLWQRITGGKRAAKASQEFIPNGRQIINRGTFLGTTAEVTAQGTYRLAEEEDATSLPMRIVASVATGQLIAFGFNIPLPIKGSGLVDLLYLDQDVRIFRSPQGSVTVQKRANAE